MSRSINPHHHHHQRHHEPDNIVDHRHQRSHQYDPQILVPFDYNLIYYFNLYYPIHKTNTTKQNLLPTRNTHEFTTETRLRLGLVSRIRTYSCSRSCPVWDAYRVWTRLRRHRLPAHRGVRHHQRLVQLQSARRQGLRQLSDLQAQERLQQQPGESLLVVG